MLLQEVPQQYHFVYRTTNLVNNKYYIGKHSTYNLEDSYPGSGDLIKAAVRKYGQDNFSREILAFFDDEDAAFDEERNLVGPEQVADPQCYNLVVGGKGGWSGEENPNYGKTRSAETIDIISLKAIERWKDLEYKEKMSIAQKARWEDPTEREKQSQTQKKRFEDPTNHPMYGIHRFGIEAPMYEKTHTSETREKLSQISKGRTWYVNEFGETRFEYPDNQELFDLGYKYGRKWKI